jgi:uncharacterized protein with ParB-like and HNH nuclease domain
MVQPTRAKIVDLFKSSYHFSVPKYQREYTWGKTEALEFWEDLISSASDDGHPLFLGTLIFKNDDEEKEIEVVDGQQRLTTILLLLIACRQVANEINTKIASKTQEKITFVSDTTGKSEGCRLKASESIRDLLEFISNEEWNGIFPEKINKKSVKRQVAKIKPIYEFFHEQVSEANNEKLSDLLEAIYNSYVVRIDISDEIEAFSIFERTNARGIDLEASDLLKNFLFKEKVKNLEDTWADIVDNAEGKPLRMLKYFYVAHQGAVTKASLYKKIKKFAKEQGPDALVDELKEFSTYYAAMREANEEKIGEYFDYIDAKSISSKQDRYQKIYFCLEGLRLFKISQIYPLAYAAIKCFLNTEKKESSDTSAKSLIKLFEALEKYHFINTAICEKIGNEVEKLYADFCVNFSTSKDFIKTAKELTSKLKEQLASEDTFVSKFIEISYSQENIPLIVYIFDRITNHQIEPSGRVKLYNSETRIVRKNHNIEHFFPQNPENKAHSLDDETVNNIGNLLVIGFKDNSRLGNLLPAEKIKKLQGSLKKDIQNKIYIEDFVNKYEAVAHKWDAEQIRLRARDLAELSFRQIWSIN